MKSTIGKIAFVLLVSSMTSCNKDKCVQEIPEWCHTVDLSNYNDPVCGCDGNTYQSPEHAECLGGITEYSKGECK